METFQYVITDIGLADGASVAVQVDFSISHIGGIVAFIFVIIGTAADDVVG